MPAQTYIVVSPTDVALPPPPGVTPEFGDPYTLRPYHNVASSLGLIFTSVFLLARLYTKVRILKKLRWEDCFCVLGWAFYCAWIAMKFEVSNAGGGTHEWNLTAQQLSYQKRYSNYADILYSLTACFIKISIILLVLRIFCPQTRDRFYWMLQGLNAANTIFYICYFIIPIVECTPRERIWHKNVSGTCLNIYALYESSAVINACSDIAMFFVPLWRIWNLQISAARKLGISAIFFSGSFAIISSVIRLYYQVMLTKNADYSYVKMQASLWTHAEVSFGLICSCLFVLPRLYRHLASIPAFGTDEYEDYKRRKSSGGWYTQTSRSRGRTGSGKPFGGIDTDIEKPAVPPKSWLNSGTTASDGRSPKTGDQGLADYRDKGLRFD